MNPHRDFYDSLLSRSGGAFDYEGVIATIYRGLLRPGDCAVDVGAHRGDHTYQMLQSVGAAGRVIAVEPVTDLARNITASVDRFYPHLRSALTLHVCGVSDQFGTADFYYSPGALAGLSGLRNRCVLSKGGSLQKLTVPLCTIDSLCAEAPAIRFIKIDIEGGEYHALLGARRTIERHRPVICFEHGPLSPEDFGYRESDFIALWSSLGYRVFDVFGNEQNADAWIDPVVWDFTAVPAEVSHASLFRPIAVAAAV